MKKFLYLLLTIFILLTAFVVHVLNSTGFFRTVENHNTEAFIKSIPLLGTEDMTVSQDGEFLIISATKRGLPFKDVPHQDGIYFMDLSTEEATPKLISGSVRQAFHPHGIDLVRLDSNKHRLFVINHVEEVNSVEVFTLYNRDSLVFEETLTNETMISPNDIVAIGDKEFYFTNDKNETDKWGKFQADYMGKAACQIIHFDGENYKTVAQGLAYANGINYDADRKLMYIAATRGFLINVYERADNGNLTLLKTIPCKTGVDNIEFDTNGDVYIGCHPSLLAYQSYASGKADKSPSEIIKLVYNDDGSHNIEKVFVDDGATVSSSSTATIFKDKIFVGNVVDDHFVVLKK